MILALVHLIVLSTLCFSLGKRCFPSIDKKIYWTGLAIRIMGSLCFAGIFTFWIKEGDTISFFNRASNLADLAKTDFSQYLDFTFSSQYHVYKSENRDGFFVKILSVLCLATNNNYWISTLYFSVVSFFSASFLVNTLISTFSSSKWPAVIAFLILPSPIFWTSGILKDTLVFFSLAILAALLIRIYFDKPTRWRQWILVILCLFLLWKLRYFLFGLLAIFYIIIILDKAVIQKIKNRRYKLVIYLSVLAIGILAISIVNPNLYLHNFPQAIFDNYKIIIANSEVGNTVIFNNLQPTWKTLISTLPVSLFSGLFRPHIFEGNPFYLLHMLENLIIFSLSIITLFKIKTVAKPPMITWLAILYVLILATLIPIASPNFGTLMRYKAMYLPVLFYLISIIPYKLVFPKDNLKV